MKFLEKIVPPGDPFATWRFWIAMFVVMLSLNGLSGRGSIWGLGQYAYASDVQEQGRKIDQQGKKIDRILTLQIASTLRSLRQDECRSNGNRSVIQSTIEDYQQQMLSITGNRYPLPSCEKT
jgi:hypothetical protein